MKSVALLTAALLWQGPLVVQLDAPARPEHLHYMRSVQVLSGGSGMACAVLDATVLGHTASAAHTDVRLFQRLSEEPEVETPYTLTESGPEPVADTRAAASAVRVHGNEVSFDLQMPPRPYSEIKLQLAMAEFVATAVVQGVDARGARHPLGSVALYDLTAEGLGRWMSLLPGEASWPVLHVELHVRTPGGAPRTNLDAGVVEGAEVPPSRLRQTRYVPTESTALLEQRGPLSVAILRVPAHVPVERVAFELKPGYGASFARDVTVSARADDTPITDTEALEAGTFAHVDWPSGDPGLYPIAIREDALDATLGATLVRPATVLVAVNNAGRPPLPIRQVFLEMRERKLCFFADREATYTLRYGEEGLTAPTYDESALRVPATALEAVLGPERQNPQYHPRQEGRSLLKRHPELFWLVVLLCGGMMGGSALHHVQHRRG